MIAVAAIVFFVIAISMYDHGLAIWDEGRHADSVVWVTCSYAVCFLIVLMLLGV